MLVVYEYCVCGILLYIGNPDGSAEGTDNLKTMIRLDGNYKTILRCVNCNRLVLQDGYWMEFKIRLEEQPFNEDYL